MKDKLFFFVDYERTTQRQLAGPDTRQLPTARCLPATSAICRETRSSTIPPLATQRRRQTTDLLQRRVERDLSQPHRSCVCSDDPTVATLGWAGVRHANALNNFAGSGTALFNRDNADFKINYDSELEKSTIFGRYSFSKSLVFDPPLLGDAGGDATNGGQLGNAPG